MRKAFLLVLSLLLICCKTMPVSNEKKIQLIKEADFITISLELLIKSNPTNDSQVLEIVGAMYKKMYNKELNINIDSTIPENIYEGASFNVPEDRNKNPYISISPYLINIYKKQPSIVYSILVHEFTHAYSFFNDKEEFIKAQKNALELYLYEMDASYVEGLFIKDYLVPRKYQLTEYENFLLQSLEQDNLSIYSISLRSTDRALCYALTKIVRNEQTTNDKIKSIELIGNELLQNLALNENEWYMYCAYMTYKTYIKFTPEILLRIAHNDLLKRKEKGIFNIGNYPEIEKILKEMSQKIDPYNNAAMKYYKNIYNKHMEL